MSQISVTNTQVILRQEYIFLSLGNITELILQCFRSQDSSPPSEKRAVIPWRR